MSTPTSTLKSCIPFPLEEDQLVEVVEKAKDWAIMHGAAMRSKQDFNPDALQFAPFILTPSSFPRVEFQKAVNLQPVLNELIHTVAHDSAFLFDTLKSTVKVDDFTRSLIEIYRTVLDEGITQTVTLALLRSDYLPNFSDAIKQVEINTIASSFGGISTNMTPMHSYILTELGYRDKLVNLPENKALSGLCDAMVEAWKLQNRPDAAILFVVEDVTYNICDQRFHEFYIRSTYPHVPVVRRTLTEIQRAGRLGTERELLLALKEGEPAVEVSVVYFRAGYEPGHYHGADEWAARLLVERSRAIKCPSIQYHLAGTKKVQQALARPDVLRRFVGADEAKIDAIRDVFTGLYSLDPDEGGAEAVALAKANPERFVLKPQREGGGNNVYGADIPTALDAMTPDERSAWILMERIFPPLSTGYMIRPGGPTPPPLVQLVSELGIFGAVIGTKDKILYNKQVGHMLRTKLSTANEGGVAAGLGALDSPYLID
ncbi:glutathione synthetase-like isoform X2 [Anopheles ziemanni]|uniref:glutathione synthetase-like isoform X2 n=1 Tax=Anopheles coustani TaxID=139045 RepID=UPI00265A9624|nr:glutathione synthetase-like isoform X2 [Anopheles coustani]XP_058175599.1 glutathione synthetase-like isoform X2 [Anopheles ziemanni]